VNPRIGARDHLQGCSWASMAFLRHGLRLWHTRVPHRGGGQALQNGLGKITDEFTRDLAPLRFGPPVTHVYNPLTYARAPWDAYCQRYGQGRRQDLVRDWLGIDAAIGQPEVAHPKRPILGFACPRSEVSGQRFWGWARERFATPERFFQQFFVTNYCPLCFMEQSGANRTPDKLAAAERQALFAVCDRALLRTAQLMQPEIAIGIGHFAEQRLKVALADMPQVRIARAPHPSPASPQANAGWAKLMDAALRDAGIALP
jgi:single-strand selective monofunctional uracil DNA glycosylase